MPAFEPVARERPTTASDIIKVEMERLKERKARLEEGLVAHQESIKVQQQAIQSVKDEIETIDTTLVKLGAFQNPAQ